MFVRRYLVINEFKKFPPKKNLKLLNLRLNISVVWAGGGGWIEVFVFIEYFVNGFSLMRKIIEKPQLSIKLSG